MSFQLGVGLVQNLLHMLLRIGTATELDLGELVG